MQLSTKGSIIKSEFAGDDEVVDVHSLPDFGMASVIYNGFYN